MAAEGEHAATRERTNSPSIERGKPKINSLTGAVDDIGCSAERLDLLLQNVMEELHEIQALEDAPSIQRRLYPAWVLLLIGLEKMTELRDNMDALIEVIYARSAEKAA